METSPLYSMMQPNVFYPQLTFVSSTVSSDTIFSPQVMTVYVTDCFVFVCCLIICRRTPLMMLYLSALHCRVSTSLGGFTGCTICTPKPSV
jgi:hypothetical protein